MKKTVLFDRKKKVFSFFSGKTQKKSSFGFSLILLFNQSLYNVLTESFFFI